MTREPNDRGRGRGRDRDRDRDRDRPNGDGFWEEVRRRTGAENSAKGNGLEAEGPESYQAITLEEAERRMAEADAADEPVSAERIDAIVRQVRTRIEAEDAETTAVPDALPDALPDEAAAAEATPRAHPLRPVRDAQPARGRWLTPKIQRRAALFVGLAAAGAALGSGMFGWMWPKHESTTLSLEFAQAIERARDVSADLERRRNGVVQVFNRLRFAVRAIQNADVEGDPLRAEARRSLARLDRIRAGTESFVMTPIVESIRDVAAGFKNRQLPTATRADLLDRLTDLAANGISALITLPDPPDPVRRDAQGALDSIEQMLGK